MSYVNQSQDTLEVGADPHPVHTGNKEISNGAFTLEFQSGATGITTVTKTGTFGYHDHAYARAKGQIVVE